MRKLTIFLFVLPCVTAPLLSSATDLDTIGLTLLRLTDSSLTGSGIRVAQPEAGPPWEVNPAYVGQPVNLFTWYSALGTATAFPNAIGAESAHADGVGYNFYSNAGGAAPGVLHVDNYDAEYFYTNFIQAGNALPPVQVVNQSFIFSPVTIPGQLTIDAIYDAYVNTYGVLFCSGVGNGGQVYPSATAYNGIGVGVFGASSSTGPTLDNGRSKPDLVAPGGSTSASTPYVSGAAAILLQAAARGDGGTGTASVAGNVKTIKALLLNGAVKPSGWTHTSSMPLHTNYGAGILNVFNSYKQLAAGRFAPTASTSTSSGGSHPPIASATFLGSLVGWDYRSLTNLVSTSVLNHYCFNIPTVANGRGFTLTATLVWNRPSGQTNINNLDFFLYDMSNSNLVVSSTSAVDNVEHLYLTGLPPGHYDLQVLKNGGASKRITGTETYALAFEIFSIPLKISHTGNNVVLSWPLAPTGFGLQVASTLTTPIVWSSVATPVSIVNNSNQITLIPTNFSSFYRLIR